MSPYQAVTRSPVLSVSVAMITPVTGGASSPRAFGAEGPGQLLAPSIDAALDGSDRERESHGHLFVGKALEIPQDHRFPELFGKGRKTDAEKLFRLRRLDRTSSTIVRCSRRVER